MESQLVTINNHDLVVKEYKGQRVVTLKEVDAIHERIEGTAKRNFNENKNHFIKDEDYFEISRNDVGTKFVQTYGFDKKAPKGTLFTMTGYLMLVKSLNDNLAWKIQRELVNSYFQVHSNNSTLVSSEQIQNIQEQYSKIYEMVTSMISNQSELQFGQEDIRTKQDIIQKQMVGMDKKYSRLLPTPHYTNFKNTLNLKVDALSKYLNMEHMKVLSSLYKQISVDNNIDLEHYRDDYKIENGLSNCSMLEVIDSSDELQEMMNSTIDSLLKMYGLKVKVKSEQTVFETNPIKLAINPLIQKYQDKSKGGTVTYRKVYAHMGVDWHNRQVRFKNKNKTKCLPSKTKLLLNDELLMHKFKNSINKMMLES